MPEYEFFCRTCEKTFDEHMSMKEHEERVPPCPTCNSERAVQRAITQFNVQTSRKA